MERQPHTNNLGTSRTDAPDVSLAPAPHRVGVICLENAMPVIIPCSKCGAMHEKRAGRRICLPCRYARDFESNKRASAKYLNKNRDKIAARTAKWSKDHPDKRRESARRSVAKHRTKYPQKERCRSAFSGAIEIGRIFRQPCSICGKENAEGHHEDYYKPYDVVWLCRKHHIDLHRTKRNNVSARGA